MNEQAYEQGVHDQAKSRHRRDVGRLLRLLVAAAIVLGLVIMAMDNRDNVRLGYPGGHRSAALWTVVAGAAIAGVLIGWLIKHRPRHGSRGAVR